MNSAFEQLTNEQCADEILRAFPAFKSISIEALSNKCNSREIEIIAGLQVLKISGCIKPARKGDAYRLTSKGRKARKI